MDNAGAEGSLLLLKTPVWFAKCCGWESNIATK